MLKYARDLCLKYFSFFRNEAARQNNPGAPDCSQLSVALYRTSNTGRHSLFVNFTGDSVRVLETNETEEEREFNGY